jgi:hypothetical protein
LEPTDLLASSTHQLLARQCRLEVVLKIKESQGNPRREWLKRNHPFTAVSPICEVHVNHLEALNSGLRRRATADCRRKKHDAKGVAGLQTALNVQRLLHNWVRCHWSLAKKTTLAMAMGYTTRPIKISEILTGRGYNSLTL